MASRGDEHARLLWFVILSMTPWTAGDRPTWGCNATLAKMAGLRHPRHVQHALAWLRAAGLLETPLGRRPDRKRPYGRLLVPRLDAPVRVLIPDEAAMANLWLACAEVRDRPAALVTLVVGMYVLAAAELRRQPEGWAVVPGRLADIRRFVGASEGSTFTGRMRDLERLGLVRTVDGERLLAPVSEWYQHARAMKRTETCSPIAVEIPY